MSIYLIDFENVRSGGLDGIEKLSAKDKVYVFYTSSTDTITIDVHKKIISSPARISFFKVASGGKNALDFQLATFLGYAINKFPDKNFFIISNDNGFTFATSFWNSNLHSKNFLKCPKISKTFGISQSDIAEIHSQSAIKSPELNDKIFNSPTAPTPRPSANPTPPPQKHNHKGIISSFLDILIPSENPVAPPPSRKAPSPAGNSSPKTTQSPKKSPDSPNVTKTVIPVNTGETKSQKQVSASVNIKPPSISPALPSATISADAHIKITDPIIPLHKHLEKLFKDNALNITNVELSEIIATIRISTDKNSLYTLLIKKFKQQRGSEIYRCLKLEYDVINSASKNIVLNREEIKSIFLTECKSKNFALKENELNFIIKTTENFPAKMDFHNQLVNTFKENQRGRIIYSNIKGAYDKILKSSVTI